LSAQNSNSIMANHRNHEDFRTEKADVSGLIIVTFFTFSGLTYQGYAGKSGFQDAPSGWFSNDDTHYFGN